MTNINQQVWDYIDKRIEIKKNLLDGLINTSALARKISRELDMESNIDAIISAIRRYESSPDKIDATKKVYDLFKKSRISSKTKLTSLLIRRNDTTEKKLAEIYDKIGSKRGSTIRIFEVTDHIKIIIDDDHAKDIESLFEKSEIESREKSISELTITYTADITKTPGVFATLANEMSMNNVSIIDSMICHSEHLFIIYEKDLEKAFNVAFKLTKSS